MAQQDNRNRQRGGYQQEAYSSQNRQQGGGYDSPRQPQGEYGRGRDDTWQSGSDWRRDQQQRDFGSFREDDNPNAWRSRSEQDRSYGRRDQDRYGQDRYGQGGGQYDQGRGYGGEYGQYGQYGLRDRDEDRYGQFGGYGQDQRRPSGLDRDYRGAGYAGPGGYGGGYGSGYSGSQSGYSGQRDQEQQHFDPDYSQWRREQMRTLDDDYDQWRQDRFKKFSDEFSTWRSSRQQTAGKNESGSSSPSGSKQNKDHNS